MLYRGILGTAYSGKLDGLIASHNRGGPYLRNFTVPTDPATEQQVNCRDAMRDVQNAWAAMTDDQRAAWSAYAAGVEATNRIGDRHRLTGYTAWSQFALAQYQQVEALDPGRVVSVTPPLYPIADFTEAPEIEITSGTTFEISWLSTRAWENSGNAADGFVVHIGRPHSTLKTWYQGPFIPVHWVESDDVSPPAPPLSLSIPVALSPGSGQVLDFRVRLFQEDRPNGRVWQIRAIRP